MQLTTEQYEKIMRFIDADMTVEEMEAFEKELNHYPNMRQQLDFEQSVRDEFVFNKSSKLSSIGQIDANIKETKSTPVVPMFNARKWMVAAVAASLLIALLSVVFFTNRATEKPPVAIKTIDTINKKDSVAIVNTTPDNTAKDEIDLAQLFKQYFKKDALTDTYPILLAEALTGYENGDYSTLQKFDLSSIPETRGNDNVNSKENILLLGHYYKGIAFLETNNAQQAINHFTWVIKNKGDKTIQQKATWYLALAYIKNNELDKAVELLEGHNQNKELNKKAKELLLKLQK